MRHALLIRPGYGFGNGGGAIMAVQGGSGSKVARFAEKAVTVSVAVALVAISMWFGHQRWLECRSEHSWLYCAAFQE